MFNIRAASRVAPLRRLHSASTSPRFNIAFDIDGVLIKVPDSSLLIHSLHPFNLDEFNFSVAIANPFATSSLFFSSFPVSRENKLSHRPAVLSNCFRSNF